MTKYVMQNDSAIPIKEECDKCEGKGYTYEWWQDAVYLGNYECIFCDGTGKIPLSDDYR